MAAGGWTGRHLVQQREAYASPTKTSCCIKASHLQDLRINYRNGPRCCCGRLKVNDIARTSARVLRSQWADSYRSVACEQSHDQAGARRQYDTVESKWKSPRVELLA